MGQALIKLFKNFLKLKNKKARILFIGLDNAGKTTLLYNLKFGNVQVETLPTVGFNVETLKYKNIHFTAWDVGGDEKSRAFLSMYMPNEAYCFVIDGSDKTRMNESKDCLEKFVQLKEYNKDPIVLYLNKGDKKECLKLDEFIEIFKPDEILKEIEYHIQPCQAINGKGVTDGLNWIVNILNEKNKKKSHKRENENENDEKKEAIEIKKEGE